jgi:hypothetical protein
MSNDIAVNQLQAREQYLQVILQYMNETLASKHVNKTWISKIMNETQET